MKRMCVLWMAILLAGCSGLSSQPTPTVAMPPTAETPTTLPEPTDPTQLIAVRAGETFEIVLPANSSTGYRWNIVPGPEATILEPVGQNYLSEQPVIPGSGGVEVWMLRALNPGETTITFGYYPPGDATAPEETVVFSVAVE